MKKLAFLLISLGLMSATTAQTPGPQPTTAQEILLQKAFEIAKADGHKNPEVLQAILLQESHAGAVKTWRVINPGNNAYYGLTQIKLSTAIEVTKRFPGLYEKYGFQTRTRDEVLAHLILDDEFNIEVASKYLRMLEKQYGYTGHQLMNAYNRGPGGVLSVGADFHYAIAARSKLEAFKRGS